MNYKLLFSKLSVLSAVLLLLSLTSCGFLSTGASLRVDVEVYKGPLSKDKEMQWGDFIGLIDEISYSLKTFNDALLNLARDKKFVEGHSLKPKPNTITIKPSSSNEYKHTRVVKAIGGIEIDDNNTENEGNKLEWCANAQKTTSGCLLMAQMHDDLLYLIEETKKLIKDKKDIMELLDDKSGNKEKMMIVLKKASRVANILKTKAFYWAEAYVSSSPHQRRVRITMANFSNITSEYSNQLGSRADVLYTQYKKTDPIDRKNLPLSDHLKDSNPTAFLNLYAWNRAANIAPWPDMIYHPIRSLSSKGTTDRIRAIEYLFADQYWSKINTVYASGQGKFGTALIKDDLGNWNLKSFDNDPTELLEAYGELTRAGIKEAIKLVGNSAAPGGPQTIDATLNLASRLTSGSMGSKNQISGSTNIEKFRDNTIQRLKELKSRVAENETSLKDNVVSAEEEVKKAEGDVTTKKSEAKTSEQKAGLDPNAPIVKHQEAPDPQIAVKKANNLAEDAINKAIESEVRADKIENNLEAQTVMEIAKKAKEYATDAKREAAIAGTDKIKAAKAENLGDAAVKKAELALTLAGQYEKRVELYKAKKELQDFRKKIELEARGILNGYADVINVLQQAAVPSS